MNSFRRAIVSLDHCFKSDKIVKKEPKEGLWLEDVPPMGYKTLQVNLGEKSKENPQTDGLFYRSLALSPRPDHPLQGYLYPHGHGKGQLPNLSQPAIDSSIPGYQWPGN